MTDHISRMQDERAELEQRIAPAQAFLDDPERRDQLNRTQVHLLNIQLDAMRTYARVLAIRIEHDIELAQLAAAAQAADDAVANEAESDDAQSEES